MNKTRGLMLLIAVVGALFLLACGNAAGAEPQEVAAQDPDPQSVEIVAPSTEVLTAEGARAVDVTLGARPQNATS